MLLKGIMEVFQVYDAKVQFVCLMNVLSGLVFMEWK